MNFKELDERDPLPKWYHKGCFVIVCVGILAVALPVAVIYRAVSKKIF